MRTTLILDDALFREAKKKAAERGFTLSRLVQDSLRAFLRNYRTGKKASFRLDWPIVRGTLVAGVDVADRDRLYDAMEDRD